MHQLLTLRVQQQLVERRVQLKNQILVVIIVAIEVARVGAGRGRAELVSIVMVVLERCVGEFVDRFVRVDDFAKDVRQAAVLHHTNGAYEKVSKKRKRKKYN